VLYLKADMAGLVGVGSMLVGLALRWKGFFFFTGGTGTGVA
jgi:hypothetical protein